MLEEIRVVGEVSGVDLKAVIRKDADGRIVEKKKVLNYRITSAQTGSFGDLADVQGKEVNIIVQIRQRSLGTGEKPEDKKKPEEKKPEKKKGKK